MNLPELTARLQQADCVGKSDQEAADLLNAKNIVETTSRFGSLRTLASLLTPEEYAAARAGINAAAQSPMVADMLEFLKLPGDESGNGGGIDLGNAAVRAMLDQLCTPAVAAKIKAHAERTVSFADQIGVAKIGPHHVAAARGGE
jgi:hypothetical protein